MSHFVQTKLNLQNTTLLGEALKRMGYQVEHGRRTIRNGYGGSETVDLSVVNQPIGFKKEKDGYAMVADFWDVNVDRNAFTRNLKRNYAQLQVAEACQKAGLKAGQWVEKQDGTLEMVAVRRSW